MANEGKLLQDPSYNKARSAQEFLSSDYLILRVFFFLFSHISCNYVLLEKYGLSEYIMELL